MKKRSMGWEKNFPDWEELRPGEHALFELTFRPEVWPDAPLAARAGGQETVTRKALYVVDPDPESKSLGVWTGRVESSEEPVTIFRGN